MGMYPLLSDIRKQRKNEDDLSQGACESHCRLRPTTYGQDQKHCCWCDCFGIPVAGGAARTILCFCLNANFRTLKWRYCTILYHVKKKDNVGRIPWNLGPA